MTIIEKMYAGEKLSERELRFLVTGCSPCCDTELGDCKIIKEVTGDFSRDTVEKTDDYTSRQRLLGCRLGKRADRNGQR